MSSFAGTSKSTRTIVKPILRKFTQSEKNSLDLDRPAEQQYPDAFGVYEYGTGSRSSHDIAVNPGRRGYHNRSTSGTSQFSTATGGSARAGSFVHPFAQTPRPFTPPLVTTNSYQHSLRESEHSKSPALTTEDEEPRPTFRSASNLSNRTPSLNGNSSPIFGSQPQRIQTKQSSSSRLALATSHTSLSNSLAFSPDLGSPLDTMSPSSTARASMDKGFRTRSRSEVETRGRSETIQEARRKFQEKEHAKDEKAAREEMRALEKRNQKEAQKMERGHRRSSASDGTRTKPRTRSDPPIQEKSDFQGTAYGTVQGHALPHTQPDAVNGVRAPRRSHTGLSGTKMKTHSTWTKFMMWFRTRILRISDKHKKNRSESRTISGR